MLAIRVAITLVLVALIGPVAGYAVDPLEFDDFEGGTTESWEQGQNTGQPTNESDGGPGGLGDAYLQTISTGTGGAGSRMVVFNEDQWTGNFNALGSEVKITMMAANLGATTLHLRLGLLNTSAGPGVGGRFVSLNAFELPPDGVWRRVIFTLSEDEMLDIGTATLSDTLGSVEHMRLISVAGPSWIGDLIAGTLGVDDIAFVLFADGFESGDTTRWSSSEE